MVKWLPWLPKKFLYFYVCSVSLLPNFLKSRDNAKMKRNFCSRRITSLHVSRSQQIQLSMFCMVSTLSSVIAVTDLQLRPRSDLQKYKACHVNSISPFYSRNTLKLCLQQCFIQFRKIKHYTLKTIIAFRNGSSGEIQRVYKLSGRLVEAATGFPFLTKNKMSGEKLNPIPIKKIYFRREANHIRMILPFLCMSNFSECKIITDQEIFCRWSLL